MIRTWGRVLLEGMSKNEKVQFFDSQIYLFVNNLNTINLKLFRNHGRIYKFEKKFKKYFGEINALVVHRNLRGCILEVDTEEIGWQLKVCSFTILLILT